MIYTTKEVADMLKYKHETIRKKCRSGEIKAVKVGKEYRISEEEVERLKRGN